MEENKEKKNYVLSVGFCDEHMDTKKQKQVWNLFIFLKIRFLILNAKLYC